MRKRSIPRSTSTGQTTSRNAAASTNVPSEALGAAFFAANATAKCPMNILFSAEQRFLQASRHRIVAEPDPEQRAVEILAFDGCAPGLAVQDHSRSRAGKPVERDDVAFLRPMQRAHDGDELVDPSLQGFLLGGGCVVADAFVERVGHLL